jgi:hypothetical protein
VRVRVIGQNSAEVADEVREGRLEAGLVVLPVDDRGSTSRRRSTSSCHYVTADPARAAAPVSIEQLAARR